LNKFFTDINSGAVDAIILATSGNTGNKNILAASIAFKLPFALYLLLSNGWLKKIIGAATVFIGLFALFILNARATFVGIGAVSLVYFIYEIFIAQQGKLLVDRVRPAILFVAILAIAVTASILVFDNAALISGQQSGGYSNPIKRIGQISVAESGRSALWSSAYKHMMSNPLAGAGYGNWKLASIPYERFTSNDFIVAYHSHNDFFEFGAELGIPGFVLYLGMFLTFFIFMLRRIFSKSESLQNKLVWLISSMAMLFYLTDATFNFPSERTIMQTNFAFAAALFFIVIPQFSESFKWNTSSALSINFGKGVRGLTIIATILGIYVNSQVFDGMKGQRLYYPDVDKGISQINSFEYDFPTYPQLSYNTMPIKAVMARYKMKDKKYEEAIKMLDEASKENPYLHFSDFLKAGLYFEWGKPDSGYKYAGITFENKPRSFSAYKNWLYATSLRSDSTAIQNAFETYTKYRNEPVAWKEYALAMIQAKKRSDDKLIQTIDSAIVLFPDSTDMLRRLRADLERYRPAPVNGGQPVPQQRVAFTPEQVAEATMHNNNATRLFNEKKFEESAKEYLAAAAIDTRNFALYENAGVCYYSLNNFPQAIKYFDMAINVGSVAALKSYFYKGVAQVNSGKKEAGCASMNFAIQKGFQGDQSYFNSVCK
jgi:tetratricopeptide (TPR) repeat protein